MLKKKLEELVIESGLASEINESRALIMSGKVLVNDMCEDKPGMKFSTDKIIRLRSSKKTEFVSRGGLKLQKALDNFKIDVKNYKCMDIGCSTGGFTDLLLRRGAAKVYSVDVGSGQLDWKLRNDDRVIVMEKTNIRNVEINDELSNFDFICVDVSFISIKLILDKIAGLLKHKGRLVLLIKPQFEAERKDVESGGIVRDETVHEYVIKDINAECEKRGLKNVGIAQSPITGAKGNIEFLGYYIYE